MSVAQVNQGLYFICSHGSEYFHAARESKNKELQVEWVFSILLLYRDLFTKLCSDYFGHLDAGPEPPSPLNETCYMFWDLDCLEGAAMFPGEEHLVDPIFQVLTGILELPSLACQESALHGLGHLQMSHGKRVQQIIGATMEVYRISLGESTWGLRGSNTRDWSIQRTIYANLRHLRLTFSRKEKSNERPHPLRQGKHRQTAEKRAIFRHASCSFPPPP